MAKYEHIKYNNNEVQVGSAIRDGNGKEISKHYVDKNSVKMFSITEDIVTVTTDTTKGVAPYSTSYGYTNIEIDKDSGISWIEGAGYLFDINTKLVVASANRNVRIRIGGDDDGDSWHPIMTDAGAILAGSTYFTKANNRLFQYKTTYQANGALHMSSDTNSTYEYLVNRYTAGTIIIDSNGYGVQTSLIFATTPVSNKDERYSSLVTSRNTKATKEVFTNLTFYIDRPPIYHYPTSTAAGGAVDGVAYETYSAMDLRYTCNISATYLTPLKKVFLWLKDFDKSTMSFKADSTEGNIVSIDKLSTRFPSTTQGDIYLYYLGANTTSWYQLGIPNRQQKDVIYKYTPSTDTLELVQFGGTDVTEQTVTDWGFAKTTDLATVASTGSYNDLSDKPTIPDIPTNLVTTDTEQTISGKKTFTNNQTDISGFGVSKNTNLSGSYNMWARTDNSNPILGFKAGSSIWYFQATSGNLYLGPTSTKALYMDANGNGGVPGTFTTNGLYAKTTTDRDSTKYFATNGTIQSLPTLPTLATVATSGSYNDLSNKPTLATVATTGSYSSLLNKPDLQAVAISGSYNDLSNKPTIPTLPYLNSSSTRMTGTSVVYAPSSAGTQGQVLTSNGSGAPTWTTMSGGFDSSYHNLTTPIVSSNTVKDTTFSISLSSIIPSSVYSSSNTYEIFCHIHMYYTSASEAFLWSDKFSTSSTLNQYKIAATTGNARVGKEYAIIPASSSIYYRLVTAAPTEFRVVVYGWRRIS